MNSLPPSRDDLATSYLDSLQFTPYPVQEEALLAWFASDDGILVSAPTGTGKTLIAEAAMFEALHTGKTAYYTTPLIALTEQKFRELQESAIRWGFSADDVGLVTGNRRVNPDARILVVVAEILLNRLLHPEAFDMTNVTSVVMDEFHSFNDYERGVVWELSLAMLPTSIRLMLLSATVGNAVDFVFWLRRSHGHKVQLIQSTDRKVPLTYEWVGDSLLSEHLEAIADGDDETRRTPALLFCFNRAECWSVAEQLKGKALLADGQRAELMSALERYDFSKGAGPKLKPILTRGIGVHHAGVLPKYRRIVEELFQRKLLTVCVCTETLAAGINLPARSVVLTSLVKGPPGKKKLIDASNAHQMFGRAGRPQFDDRGYVHVLAHEDDVRIARWKAQYDQIPENTKDPNLIKAKKRLKKKMPTRSPQVQYWNEEQFQKLIAAPPAKLASRGELPWRLLAYLLNASSDVSRLQKFVHKRLLDDKQLQQAEKDLQTALLTLWTAGFVALEPPPPEAEQRAISPPESVLEEFTPKERQPLQLTASETKTDDTEPEADFGDGLVQEGEAVNDEEAVIESADETPAAQDEPIAETPAEEPAPTMGSFGALLQQALKVDKPDKKAKPPSVKQSLDAKGDEEDEGPPPYQPDWAQPTLELEKLLVFRSVHPLYGWFLIRHLGMADQNERIQAFESVLEMSASVGPAVYVPGPDELPAGALARHYLDEEVLRRGLATPQEIDPPPPPKDRPRSFEERPPRPLTFAGKLQRLFNSEFPGVDVRVWPVWVAGDVLHFGDFQKYVTSRDLTKQEGLIFRHLLRMILLCGEFAQLTPPHLSSAIWQEDLGEIAAQLTDICRGVDPESTDKMLESAEQPDPLAVT